MVNMWITTDAAGQAIGKSSKKVAELCRTGKIFADKRADGYGKRKNLPYWHIELLSFTYFLTYNKQLRNAFEQGAEYMLRAKLTEMLNDFQSCEKKTYTRAEVCTILEMGQLELIKKCVKGEFGYRHIFPNHFSLLDIMLYIKKTPRAEEQLQDRYERALVNGDGRLMLYREVITAYKYFKEYGYAI